MRLNNITKMALAALIAVPAMATADTTSSDYSYAPINSFFDVFTEMSYQGGSVHDLSMSILSQDVVMIRESPSKQSLRTQGKAHMSFTGGGLSNFECDSFFDIFTELTSTGTDATGLDTYDTEMLSMSLQGGSLPNGVMIRESPSKASLGKTAIRESPTLTFQIHSFFDVFTELSIDGGQSWMPSMNANGEEGTNHMTVEGGVVPEPASMATLGIGVVALIRRRKSAK